jgi:hypothetical protein
MPLSSVVIYFLSIFNSGGGCKLEVKESYIVCATHAIIEFLSARAPSLAEYSNISLAFDQRAVFFLVCGHVCMVHINQVVEL